MSDIYFFKFLVNKQVFFKSKYCYALVNLKPIAPGHVLLVPYDTKVTRFNELNDEQSSDYMKSLQLLSKFLIWNYKADAMNISIQDGPESGQSIPHLHTHLIPRFKNDLLQNDRVYQDLEKVDILHDFELRRKAFLETSSVFKKDEDRFDRSIADMEEEARYLQQQFELFTSSNI